MNRPFVAAILAGAVFAPGSFAVDPMAIYVEATGTFHLGLEGIEVGNLGAPLGPLNTESFAIEVDPCHRKLVADLLFSPNSTDVAGAGLPLFIPFEFDIVVADSNGQVVAEATVDRSSYSNQLGTVDAPGVHSVTLTLTRGVEVGWWLRVRGFAALGEATCVDRIVVNEIEANPAGNDSGNEWIELFNPNVFAIDVSGFEIRALHGDPETFTLDDGTTVGAREFLVVEFTRGQFLDNVDETIVILDPFGAEYDRTPVSNDTENDNLTWQRRADGEKSWAFASMTRGFSNGG